MGDMFKKIVGSLRGPKIKANPSVFGELAGRVINHSELHHSSWYLRDSATGKPTSRAKQTYDDLCRGSSHDR